MNLLPLDDPGAVLAYARARRTEADQAERDVLIAVARYAEQHSPDSLPPTVSVAEELAGDRTLPLAGDGAPQVAEFAVAELGAALGLSTTAAKKLVGDVLELRYRLPRTWTRILDGTVLAWRARTVAQRTKDLPREAADWVDTQIAPEAATISYARLTRTIETALTTYDPETAAILAEERADRRRFRLDKQLLGSHGIVFLEAELDPADAADLEHAVTTIAHDLLEDEIRGTWSLGRRRTAALGEIARHYTSDSLQHDPHERPARVVHLHAHLDRGHLAETGMVEVDELRAIVPIETLLEWCAANGTVINPIQVIDLNAEITRNGHQPAEQQHHQAALRSPTCVFPHCDHTTWTGDTDHIDPYQPDGPPRQTTTSNLAKLCRQHHRLKTHGGWTYHQPRPGQYLWRSPHGYCFLVSHGHTTELRSADLTRAG